jgi:hypothetical protein
MKLVMLENVEDPSRNSLPRRRRTLSSSRLLHALIVFLSCPQVEPWDTLGRSIPRISIQEHAWAFNGCGEGVVRRSIPVRCRPQSH